MNPKKPIWRVLSTLAAIASLIFSCAVATLFLFGLSVADSPPSLEDWSAVLIPLGLTVPLAVSTIIAQVAKWKHADYLLLPLFGAWDIFFLLLYCNPLGLC